MRRVLAIVSGLVALFTLLYLANTRAQTTESTFSRLAGKIPFVNYGDFLYQRSPRLRIDDPRVKASEEGVKEAMAVPPDFAEISKLAGHPDSKVRTLAIMRLYSLARPEAFVAIQANMADKAPTFAHQSNTFAFQSFDQKVPLHTEDRSVGYLATQMMGMIGFPARWQDDDKREDFQKWSASRIGNPDWIGWYDFLYGLASGGSSPVPEERAPKIAALRSLMETRSAAVRAWFWFGLADDALMTPRYDTELATEVEMIAAGKQLGPEAMLAFLRDGSRAGLSEAKLDDPARGRRFVLSHGGDFFRPQDAAALKEMGLFVAAADADPANASGLIRESLAVGRESSSDSWDRARAVAALADLRGDAETDFVVKWFHDAPANSSRSSDQGVFLTELTRRRPVQWQATIRALVADSGFESLAGTDVLYLAILVNQLTGREIVRKDLLTSGSEPEARNLLRRHFGLPEVSYQHLEPVPSPKREPRWTVGLDSEAHSLAVSANGKTVAVGLREGGVRLFDAATGEASGSLAMKGSQALVRFGKSDDRLLVFDEAGTLSIGSLPDCKILSETPLNLSECDINDTVGLIATRSALGKSSGISVMDLPDGKLRWTHDMPIRGSGIIGFSQDGQRLIASDSFTHDLQLFDPNSPQPVATMKGHSEVPVGARFSPDGRWLVSFGDGKVRVWDGRTGAPIREFLCAYCGVVGFTADSKCFITRPDSRQITAFDLGSGTAVAGFDLPAGSVSDIQAARDGKRIFMTLEGANTANFLTDKAPTGGSTMQPARLVCWE